MTGEEATARKAFYVPLSQHNGLLTINSSEHNR